MIHGQSRLRHRIAALQFKAALLRLKLSIRGGYNPDQPRDDRGRWALVGGRWIRVDGRWTSGGRGRSVVLQRDRTGHQRIDAASDHLLDLALEAIEEVGPGSGKAYGVLVHKKFSDKVKQLNLPGIGKDGVEQSFSLGDTVRYGLDGSIRTDIIMRDGRTKFAPIIAVWDLKTGSAKLSPTRAREIRNHLSVGSDVSVFELKVTKGISLKKLYLILHFN